SKVFSSANRFDRVKTNCLIKLLADEVTQYWMHTELGIQHDYATNSVFLFQLQQLDAHAFKQTGTKSCQLQFSQLVLLLQLALDIRLQHMGQLSIIAHQYNAPLSHSHRYKQIQRIGPGGLIDHHGIKFDISAIEA